MKSNDISFCKVIYIVWESLMSSKQGGKSDDINKENSSRFEDSKTAKEIQYTLKDGNLYDLAKNNWRYQIIEILKSHEVKPKKGNSRCNH